MLNISTHKKILLQVLSDIYSDGALLGFGKNFVGKNPDIFIKEAEKIAKQLDWARPDEPLNQNLLNYIMVKLAKDRSKDTKRKIANFQRSCQASLGLIAKNEELITGNGIKLIKKIYQKKKEAGFGFYPLQFFVGGKDFNRCASGESSA